MHFHMLFLGNNLHTNWILFFCIFYILAGKTYAVNEDPVTVTDNDDPDSIINADNSIEHTEETKLFFTGNNNYLKPLKTRKIKTS